MSDMEESKTADGGLSESHATKNGVSDVSPGHKHEHGKSRGNSPDGSQSRIEDATTPSSTDAAVPRLSRKSSAKSTSRDPLLFLDHPDAIEDALKAFQIIPDCLYGSKNIGSTDADALDCECHDEWEGGVNLACSSDDNCINRATKMECLMGSGNCANGCQNQRFQRKQYAKVTVIKTEKKGFGLRANTDLEPGDFVYEYIGEVINEPTFRRRMIQYDNEGIKHFYFMSLNRSEFVDATKKGNLGRFCNHSCNPNCFVDKWVVGEKLRMGIFALTKIVAGEELVFNYNVDRYGAEPQPCYCGESNCVGFIGGKTQTGPATSLPLATLEALGIDDDVDSSEPTTKKPRKKKPEEDDEDYVNSIQVRGLTKDGARKVMASLRQCKEKWIAVKLLQRIQKCDEETILLNVMHMHAYSTLKGILHTFHDDNNIVLQVLDILHKFPRITRNKIVHSKIEEEIQKLTISGSQETSTSSKKLLEEWDKLEVAFRIRRRDANETVSTIFERRNTRRDEDSVPSKTASPLADAPKGPRHNQPQRNASFHVGHGGHGGYGYAGQHGHQNRGPRRPLPDGWYIAKDRFNKVYYYTRAGQTTWARPTQPVREEPVPKMVPKSIQEEELYRSIIEAVTKEEPRKEVLTPKADTPAKSAKEEKIDRGEKWRTFPLDKQKKLYENTLAPHVMHVMNKYRGKFPKDELKKLAKDANKALVASDYKHDRVGDPTAPISDKTQKKVKLWLKEYFDRAVVKWERHTQRSKDMTQEHDASIGNHESTPLRAGLKGSDLALDADIIMSDDEGSPDGADERKRKRDDGPPDSPLLTPTDAPEPKRLKEDSDQATPPPPPPPPPTAMPGPEALSSQEKLALREQEEELMRENEEAQRLEDEAAVKASAVNGQRPDAKGKEVAVLHEDALASHTHGGSMSHEDPSKNTKQHEVLSH